MSLYVQEQEKHMEWKQGAEKSEKEEKEGIAKKKEW